MSAEVLVGAAMWLEGARLARWNIARYGVLLTLTIPPQLAAMRMSGGRQVETVWFPYRLGCPTKVPLIVLESA